MVYTTSDSDAEKLNGIIGRLSGRHPLRAIVLSAEPERPTPSLDTAIRTYCFTDPATGKQACCEQVVVGAYGEPANHLTGIVVPLLLPDLPLYLWWMGEPNVETSNFTSLVRSAQKLIIDSSTFTPSPEAYRALLEIARNTRRACTVSDLNWFRLWPMFEAIAQFFDDRALRPHLFGIEKVTVEYARAPGSNASNPSQAALMAAWLYSRLGEEPKDVELKAVEREGAENGNVLSFEMRTRHGDETAAFRIAEAGDSGRHANACATVGDRTLLDRVVMLNSRSQEEMLDLALESARRDVAYEESLELAARFLEKEQTR
ncbi:MAG: glucose-6-phosphate dehydrogenase assembly protein OpcA [Chloroflexia bacterium]